jgi:hypothetical protein
LQGAAAAGYPIPNTSQYGTDDAPYIDSGNSSVGSQSGSLEAQAVDYANAFVSYVAGEIPGNIDNGTLYGDYGTIGSNNFLNFYEMGPNGYSTPGTTEQSYLSEAGFPSAMWMASAWMRGMQLGAIGPGNYGLRTPIQNEFTLAQTEFGANGTQAPIWGVAHDLDSDFGPAFPHLRPIALGMAVVNSAIGGAYYPVVGAPSRTVINAFKNAGAWSAVLVNTNGSSITVTLVFPGSGTLPQTAETVLNTNGLTDNSENSNDVYLGALPGGLTTAGQNVTLTLPAYSVVAIH